MYCDKYKMNCEEAVKFHCNIPGECDKNCIFF